jgi:hypothetical protein
MSVFIVDHAAGPNVVQLFAKPPLPDGMLEWFYYPRFRVAKQGVSVQDGVASVSDETIVEVGEDLRTLQVGVHAGEG